MEEIRVTHYDWMRMTGELPMKTRSEPLKTRLAKDSKSGFKEDKWKQLPSLIMIGNCTSWALMISLDLEVVSQYNYRFKKMIIQTELLDLLRDLPVCVGLGVKGDVHEIEQFYTEVSGVNLEMAGFIDLSALALLAGYQMNARGMTPMGVQVLGAVLNKCVSTRDGKWGYRWSDIPQSLQVYGLGDLKFGHLTFIVLTGILVRDIFPDPDVVCQFLNGNQRHALTWFYEWILSPLKELKCRSMMLGVLLRDPR